MARDGSRRPSPIGVRGGVLLALSCLAVWAYLHLGLDVRGLIPNEGGLELAGRFLGRAFTPAMTSEASFVPAETPPLLVNALSAAWRTVLFAAAAMSLSLVLGVVLGFLASTAWWAGDPAGGRSIVGVFARRAIGPFVYSATRVLIALMRSVHELLWAVLFLVAIGLNDAAALLAIAIPFGGTLAKIFSEMVDESPRDAAHALRGAGASGLQVFFFGLVPRAVPDMTAYAFYRFECALRSSAVLGFFGFETLGLYIRQSFKSSNYGEVWTYLYTLIALVMVFDWWSGALRRRLVVGGCDSRAVGGVGGVPVVLPSRPSPTATRPVDLASLHRSRPRDRVVRASLWIFAALLLASWWMGAFDVGEVFSARRADNLARFWSEVRPYPLRGADWDWGVVAGWAVQILDDRGTEAVFATLAISVLAIALAGLASLGLTLPAARSFATPEPFLPSGRSPSRRHRLFWGVVVAATRLLLVGLRAVPEYLWAFLLVAMLGPTAWPAVLALALHNAGILGRLGAETVENVEPRTLRALRGSGAGRAQIAAMGLWPAILPRLLLYFFYRWETCVREATVLGMLGVVSLGYWIDDARTRQQYDTFVFLILLGSLIVLVGDLVSALARNLVRRAS